MTTELVAQTPLRNSDWVLNGVPCFVLSMGIRKDGSVCLCVEHCDAEEFLQVMKAEEKELKEDDASVEGENIIIHTARGMKVLCGGLHIEL